MASRPRRASPSAVHNCCTPCCHTLLATCSQRRAARTGNGTHDALLNATLGCRTNCLRDPQNTSRIRRPSTTTTRARQCCERAQCCQAIVALFAHTLRRRRSRSSSVVPHHRASLLLVVLGTNRDERVSWLVSRALRSFLSYNKTQFCASW